MWGITKKIRNKYQLENNKSKILTNAGHVLKRKKKQKKKPDRKSAG